MCGYDLHGGVWLHWQIPPLTWGSIRTSTASLRARSPGQARESKRCSPGLLLAAPSLRRPDEQIPDGGGLNLIQPLRAFSRGAASISHSTVSALPLRSVPSTCCGGSRSVSPSRMDDGGLPSDGPGAGGLASLLMMTAYGAAPPSRNLIPASAVGRLEALASDVLRRRGLSVRAGKGIVRVRARYFHAARPGPPSDAEQSTRDLGDDRKDH